MSEYIPTLMVIRQILPMEEIQSMLINSVLYTNVL